MQRAAPKRQLPNWTNYSRWKHCVNLHCSGQSAVSTIGKEYMHSYIKYVNTSAQSLEWMSFWPPARRPYTRPLLTLPRSWPTTTWRQLTVSPDRNIHIVHTHYNCQSSTEFARLPPEQLIEKIKSMHDQIYKLGIRESKEMTRGKLLGIFGARERQTTKDVPPMRHS